MNLNSFLFVQYLTVLIIVLGVIQCFQKRFPIVSRIQLIILLIFSYYNICISDWHFGVCCLFVSLLSYSVGIYLYKNRSRTVLVISVALLVLFLAFFKYAGFFVSSFTSFWGLDPISFDVILPIGISFYIFSSISYLIDVYNKKCKAETSFINYSLYISFFPKFIAGPIVRGYDFFNQINSYRGIRWEHFKTGIQMFMLGLFKKIVLADHLSVFVNDVYHAPNSFNTITVVLAVFSYSMQIYFDFSGYSDMAIGISRILGFEFNKNFNLPYIACSLSDFWKRWHISLSFWLRDYIYIPLGGNRKGMIRQCFNLFVVMLISGFWHGAGITFIVWGILHGLLCCLEKLTDSFFKISNKHIHVFKVIITFTIVSLLWVVFRSDNLSNAIEMYKSLFTLHSGINQPYMWTFFSLCYLLIEIFYSAIVCKRKSSKASIKLTEINVAYPIMDLTRFSSQVLFFVLCGLTIILGYYGNTAFIYGIF